MSYKRDAKYPNALKAAHTKKTAKQIQVKAAFFHSEFGMIAGFLFRSCQPTQKMKAGIRARPMLRRMILRTSLSSDVLAVRILYRVSKDRTTFKPHSRKNIKEHSKRRACDSRSNPINLVS